MSGTACCPEPVSADVVARELAATGVLEPLIEAVVRDRLPVTGAGRLLPAVVAVIEQRLASRSPLPRPVRSQVLLGRRRHGHRDQEPGLQPGECP